MDTAMRYYLIPVRKTIIKKKKKLRSVGENVEEREPLWSVNEFVHWYSNYGKL